jgi:hypothetical protein
MTLAGVGRFDLAYFRHAERWYTVFRALTAAECFKRSKRTRSTGQCDLVGKRLAPSGKLPYTGRWSLHADNQQRR